MSFRKEIRAISIAVHPFRTNNDKQTSKEISDKLHDSLNILHSIVDTCNVKDNYNALGYFENQITSVSSLTEILKVSDNSPAKIVSVPLARV